MPADLAAASLKFSVARPLAIVPSLAECSDFDLTLSPLCFSNFSISDAPMSGTRTGAIDRSVLRFSSISEPCRMLCLKALSASLRSFSRCPSRPYLAAYLCGPKNSNSKVAETSIPCSRSHFENDSTPCFEDKDNRRSDEGAANSVPVVRCRPRSLSELSGIPFLATS